MKRGSRRDGPEGWTSPESAERWGRIAVYAAIAVPVLYALNRYAFALGIPLGIGGVTRSGGTFILPDTLWGQQIGALETDVNQYADRRPVQGIVFACAYIRRELLTAIGALSEEYRSYFEDTDYCLRAAAAGFRTRSAGRWTGSPVPAALRWWWRATSVCWGPCT